MLVHMENTVLATGVAIKSWKHENTSLATQPPFPTIDICTAASNKY